MPGLGDLGELADNLRKQEEASRRSQLSMQPRAGRDGAAAQRAVERIRARKAAKSQPATVKPVAKPTIEPSRARISEVFRPWEERSGGKDFWEGMNERDALDKADAVHRGVQRGELGIPDIQRELNMTFDEARSFRDYRGRGSKTREFGVPHAAAQENMWAGLMTESGNPTRSLSDITGDPQVTDLISKIDGKDRLIDVQNIVTRAGHGDRISLDFIKNLRGRNVGMGTFMFNEADDNASLRSIIQRITRTAGQRYDGRGANYGVGKMLQSRDFEGLDVGLPDGDMRSPNRRSTYAKDALIGGIYQRENQVNLTGSPNHGTYNPRLPKRGVYAIDLEKGRSILDMTKKDIVALDGRPLTAGNKLTLTMPLENVQEFSGGRNFFKELVDSPVMQMARRVSQNPTFRAAGLALGAIPVLGDVADAAEGTHQLATAKSNRDVKRGASLTATGVTGLASVAAPVLAPVAAGMAVGNLAADVTEQRRANDKKYTRNAPSVDKHIHSEANPVTIQGPTVSPVVSETVRRRAARRSTPGINKTRPTSAQGWWSKAKDALGI